MRLKEWLDENACAGIVTGLVIFVAFCFTVGFFKHQRNQSRMLTEKSEALRESFLLADPVWLPEAEMGFGGKVYLLEVKGHKLAVVISNRGAGICELREETNHE